MDPDGHGIHLAWSGPELLPLSIDGYEVRRRKRRGRKRRRICTTTLERATLVELERVGMLPDELGTIRCRQTSWPRSLLPPPTAVANESSQALDPSSAGGGVARSFDGRLLSDPGKPKRREQSVQKPAYRAVLEESWTRFRHLHELPSGSSADDPPKGFGELADEAVAQIVAGSRSIVAALAEPKVVVFTQELAAASDSVFVRCDSRVAIAIAIAAGKALDVKPVQTGIEVRLAGQSIDTVVVYSVSPWRLRFCAEAPLGARESDREWRNAEVLARGLTLPLVETDPALGDRSGELAAARSRLVPPETLDDPEADRLAAALREAAGRADLGRPCDRVMLSRADIADPFQETLFSARIALLTLHPRWRRILGFGFADRTAIDGESYDYRISGRFDTADLDDDVYDVHNVPSGTPLPTIVRIRDLTLAFPVSTKVVLDPPPDPAALQGVSRRGIELESLDDPFGWIGADLFEDLACVIELPQPTDTVVLELGDGHDLRYAGADNGDPYVPLTEAVPAGPQARLNFPAPVGQVRLAGRGTLFAVRLLSGATGNARLYREAGSVTLAAKPLPQEPLVLWASNLQTPAAVLTGPIGEQTKVPARPQPGFRIKWVPATDPPLTVWPEDLGAGPPLESIAYQVEHRRVYPGAGTDPWDQIHAGDNLSFGSWPASSSRPEVSYGVDLDAVFPVHPMRDPGTPVVMAVTDVFGVRDPETGATRPSPPLGSYHQYRIRAMDVVGRLSGGWRESNRPRLEKHVPPPLPVGPQPPPLPAGDPPRLTGPVGVRARAIVGSDPRLTEADRQLLDGHQSAVLLEWGWRDAERQLDPSTSEFRVYLQEHDPTEVPGTITNVTASAGTWTLDYLTNRWLFPDECAGQWLNSGGWSFKIQSHSGGFTPQLTLAASVVNPAAAPVLGSAVFGRPLSPQHHRPSSWTARVDVVPLGSADTYRYLIFDAVDVDEGHRTHSIWVGVSAADSESYMPDELPAIVPNGGRAGNESSIAAIAVHARYRGRPTFSVPPPLGEIPEVVTDEPTGRQVRVALDGPTLLGGALPATANVALDRCPADAILAITTIDGGGNVLMRRADATTQVVVFPNPSDEAVVVAALQSNHPERIPSRYLLFLLGHFDRPAELLRRTGDELTRFDALSDAIDPKPGRYFYRVRLGDAAGAVSEGGAILPAVVRVPSTAPAPTPRRVAAQAAAAVLALTVDVDPDPELRWLLLFTYLAAWDDGLPEPGRAQLLRMPNRRDLYPTNGIRLRVADGTLLTPVAKLLADPDVTVEPDGSRRLTVHAPLAVPPAGPAVVQYWCYALSRDGIPSRPLGPRSTGVSP
jgi:hypothetical protein